MAGQLLLGLSILVIIHELGHFLAARAFGIKVEKFYLFFDAGGVKLFKFKKGETEYGVGWLPLGGYVKIAGMIDESMDKKFIESPAEPWEFRSKPVWQRMIVILGGIIMNVILGILIFSLHTFYFGQKYLPASEMKYGIEAKEVGKKVGFETGDKIIAVNGQPVKKLDDILANKLILDRNVTFTVDRNGATKEISLPENFGKTLLNEGPDKFISINTPYHVDQVVKGSNAEKAGLKEGDKIVKVNGKDAVFFNQLTSILQENKDKEVKLEVLRKSQNEPLTLTAKVDEEGRIGFRPGDEFEYKTETFGLGESFVIGNRRAWTAVSDNVKGLWRIITNDLPANKSLHSFIGIAQVYGGQWDWNTFWSITGLLSMVLAIMNLLPIPALDGGYVIFLIAEAVRGRPVSYRFLEIAQMVGIGFLVLLMGFAFYNDLTQFVFK